MQSPGGGGCRVEREIIEAQKWHKEELHIRGFELESLPLSVCQPPITKTLFKLDLSHNFISELPPSISKLVNLRHLCCSHNQLLSLPEELGLFNYLKTLDVSRNKISRIPKCLTNVRTLEIANFSGNKIELLNPEVLSLPNLQRLYVTKNPITNVPREVFLDGLDKLRQYFELYLSLYDSDSLTQHLEALTISGSTLPSSSAAVHTLPPVKTAVTSDYGSCSNDLVSVNTGSVHEDSCSCFGDCGSDGDPDFDDSFSESNQPCLDEILSSDSDFEEDGYIEKILPDRTKLLRYGNVTVHIPQHNKSGHSVHDFHMEILEDWMYKPDTTERAVHASQVVCVEPHGAKFYVTEPAILTLPLGVGVDQEDQVICLCSNSVPGNFPVWEPIPKSDYKWDRDRVTIRTWHFSLFTVIVSKPYPEVVKEVLAGEGGHVIVDDVPGVEVHFPKGALQENIDARIKVYYADEPYARDDQSDGQAQALATPVVMVGPHGCQFKPNHYNNPVTLRLPLPDCGEIMRKFKVHPQQCLTILHSDTDETQPLCWERLDVKYKVENDKGGNFYIRVPVTHFSWYKAVWDLLAGTLHRAKVGASYFYPYIRFSMMCIAMMEENKDTRTFGLEVICYRSDKKLPEVGNYKHRVGGSIKPKMVRPGPVIIRLASNDFEADVLHGEDPSLTKVELDFRGMEFEKQFACVFKGEPVEKGVFGKVFVERLVVPGIPAEAICEFNLTKNGNEADVMPDTTDRWSLMAVKELAAMLNITADNNWKKFAKHLGFTNHEIRNRLSYTEDPFAFMLTMFQNRGGTPDEFVQSLYEVSRSLRMGDGSGSLDQIGFMNQSGFRTTDDEDSSMSDESAIAGPSGFISPPRKRGNSMAPMQNQAKRKRKHSDHSDSFSSEMSAVQDDQVHRNNKKPLEGSDLWRVSPYILDKWKFMGRTLNLPEEDILSIEHANRDIQECTYQMLLKWRERYPQRCTFGVLYCALHENGLTSVAQQYCTVPKT